MNQIISFKVGDVVAANTVNGIELGLIYGGDPENNSVKITWTDGNNLVHSVTETAAYRSFFLRKVVVA